MSRIDSFETKLHWFEGISEEAYQEVFKQERYINQGIVGINKWRKRLQGRVKSAPVKGAANAELIDYISTLLEIPKDTVNIDSGTKDRRKRILLSGISQEEVSNILDAKMGIYDIEEEVSQYLPDFYQEKKKKYMV